MCELAERHGAEAPKIRVPRAANPTLMEAALNNAVHGCIFEAWSALMVLYRAEHSTLNREVFNEIARDEVFHAELAWDIHDFLMPRLRTAERILVRKQMEFALERLETASQGHAMLVAPGEELRARLAGFFRSHLHGLVVAA
jgi:hypothetical protein